MRGFTDFTGVKRVTVERPAVQPFRAEAFEARGWRDIGHAGTRAAAETIAKGYRTDKRREGAVAQTRVTEQARPGGFYYIAV